MNAASSAQPAALPTRMYIATSNPGKVHELRALFCPATFELVVFAGYTSPPEGDSSYTDNAALKARSLRSQLRGAGLTANVLADDSGLEVMALGGRPGVATADYGGAGATWSERRRALLAEVDAVSAADRRARFVCALHFIDGDGREFGAFATVDGTIAATERGQLGFSFDPIFEYAPLGRTFAELSETEKNRVSHRAIAAAALAAAITAAASNGTEP